MTFAYRIIYEGKQLNRAIIFTIGGHAASSYCAWPIGRAFSSRKLSRHHRLYPSCNASHSARTVDFGTTVSVTRFPESVFQHGPAGVRGNNTLCTDSRRSIDDTTGHGLRTQNRLRFYGWLHFWLHSVLSKVQPKNWSNFLSKGQ